MAVAGSVLKYDVEYTFKWIWLYIVSSKESGIRVHP
jgi:hypothetical protein